MTVLMPDENGQDIIGPPVNIIVMDGLVAPATDEELIQCRDIYLHRDLPD